MSSGTQGAEPGRDALRASDEDRERVATQLRDAHAEGRLTVEEFGERLDAVYAAKTYGELEPITRDLPRQRTPSPGTPAQPSDGPVPSVPARSASGLPANVRGGLTATVLLVGIWGITCLGSGSLIYPWFVWPVGFLWLAIVADLLGGGRGGDRSDDQGGRQALRDQRRSLRDDRRALRAQRRDERHGRAGR